MRIIKFVICAIILCTTPNFGSHAAIIEFDVDTTSVQKQTDDYPFYRWYISVGGGIGRLMAEDSRKLPFWGDSKPMWSVTAGAWITPVWGVRLQASGGSLMGFAIWNEGTNGDPGYGGGNWFLGEDHPNPIGRDRFNTYLEGAPDADPAIREFIKNNYFDLDKPRTGKDGSKGYNYSFSYYTLMADLTLNLNAAIWGREGLDDFVRITPFAGLGWAHTRKNGILPKVNSIAVRGGINAGFRITGQLGLNLESGLMLVPEVFDRLVGSNQTQDAVFSLTAALTWKFGKVKPKTQTFVYITQALPPVEVPQTPAEPAIIDECPDMLLSGLVYDTHDNPIENAVVFIYNTAEQSVKVLRTNAAGAYSTTVPCGSRIAVKAVKNTYLDDCFRFVVPQYDRAAGTTNVDLPMLILARLEKNLIISLENIHYDFDKWNIRPDAAVELDKVVAFLTQNPAVSIILGSHTDVRGSLEYNDRLSQKRAESAVAYIVSRGISSDRITAKGYGERALLIENAQTEEGHQANRRTEIIIRDEGAVEDQSKDPWEKFKTGATYRITDLPAGSFDDCWRTRK